MGISTRNRIIFVEVEATYDSAETLVGADAVQVSNLQFNPAEQARMIPREIIRDSLQPEQEVYAGSLMGFQFDVELKGSGSAGTAPRFGDLLRACGCSETVVDATSVTYEPDSDLSAHEGVTIGYKEGANYRIAKGCRGTFSINLEAGKYGVITFTMIGHISAESETAAPTASYEATVPPAFLNASVDIDGFTPKIQSMTMDIQNEYVPSEDPNQATGFGEIYITGRNTQGTINPEAEDISDNDYVADFRAGNQLTLATGTIGGTAGNRWALNFPKIYYKNVQQADRNALLTWDLTYGCVVDSGDDEFSLVLT